MSPQIDDFKSPRKVTNCDLHHTLNASYFVVPALASVQRERLVPIVTTLTHRKTY